MRKNLMLDVGQAVELKEAFRRAGWTNADIKAFCQGDVAQEVLRVLRGETSVTEPERKWREQDGIIYFSVTSDGTTGEEWIKRLKKNRFRIGDYAESVLRSKDFKPISGVTTEIAVLKGMLWSDNDRITKKIRAKASELQFLVPNAEVACLIREKFSDKDIEDMGLWRIIVMHEPIKDSDGDPLLLSADRYDDRSWLDTNYDYPVSRWDRDFGFAFALSQVSGS